MKLAAPHGNRLELRLNWLADDGVAASRLAARVSAPHRLGDVALRTVGLVEEAATYQALSRLAPVWECDFEFVSATYFSRSGRHYLLPDPELILRGIVARWNFHNPPGTPLAVADATVRGLAGRIVVKRHSIHTVRTQGHARGQGTGFVGDVRLGLRNADRRNPDGESAARLFASVCAFAPFCGVGAQTTHCFGAVVTRPVDG